MEIIMKYTYSSQLPITPPITLPNNARCEESLSWLTLTRRAALIDEPLLLWAWRDTSASGDRKFYIQLLRGAICCKTGELWVKLLAVEQQYVYPMMVSTQGVSIWQMRPSWLFWQLTESSHMIRIRIYWDLLSRAPPPSITLTALSRSFCLFSTSNYPWALWSAKSPIVVIDWHLVFWGWDNCGQLLMFTLTDLLL